MGVMRGRAGNSGRTAYGQYGSLWTRQGQRLLIAATLALLASSLLLLADATGAVPDSLLPHTPLHARNAHAANPTAPPIETATPTSPPPVPVIKLISPPSGQGPVGAHVSISGHDFSGSTATIFASSHPDCNGAQETLATPTLSNGSFGTTTFIWPTNLNPGTWYICANNLTSGAPTYQVVGSGPPTLSLSVATASPGDAVTITGSNFVGYTSGTTINITESSGGTPLTLQGATLGPDGSFSVSETLSKTMVGNNVTLNAYSPADAGAPPVLQASASLTVEGLTPSPTVIVTPTTASIGGGVSTGGDTNKQSGNTGLIVLLIVGIVLALLVILGVVAYLVLRGRSEGEPGTGGEYGAGSGFGGASGYGHGTTGRHPQVNPFGHPGAFDTPNAYTEPFAAPSVGGVSQWDEPETTPGPDWQPRPMTGYGLGGETQADYPVSAPQQPTRPGSYPPVDPWDTPSNQANQPGRNTPPGYPPESSLGGATGRTRATGPTGSNQPGGWSDEPTDSGWGGSGATRPGTYNPTQRVQPPGNEPGW